MVIVKKESTPLVVTIDEVEVDVDFLDLSFKEGAFRLSITTSKGSKPRKSIRPNLVNAVLLNNGKKIFPLKKDFLIELNTLRKRKGVVIVEGLTSPVDLVSEEFNIQNIRGMEQAIESLVEKEVDLKKITISKPPVVVFESSESNYFVLFERVCT